MRVSLRPHYWLPIVLSRGQRDPGFVSRAVGGGGCGGGGGGGGGVSGVWPMPGSCGIYKRVK